MTTRYHKSVDSTRFRRGSSRLEQCGDFSWSEIEFKISLNFIFLRAYAISSTQFFFKHFPNQPTNNSNSSEIKGDEKESTTTTAYHTKAAARWNLDGVKTMNIFHANLNNIHGWFYYFDFYFHIFNLISHHGFALEQFFVSLALLCVARWWWLQRGRWAN